MFARARRYLVIIALLLCGVGLAWGQRWGATAPPPPAELAQEPEAQAAEQIYFLDIEGWYRITPYETVVRSPYDLTAQTTEAMAQALPTTVGAWQQTSPDEDIGDDPSVVEFLKEPTVALQRTYRHPSGQELTLALIGNRGEDSFLLFSHTPETCYPGRLWQVMENRRESALLAPGDERPMYAQYLLTQQAETGERLMVLFWYLWDNPRRDVQDGVLSIRVNLFLGEGEREEEILPRAWDFIRALFPMAVPWDRF
jgi:hypothetical protein